jgi:hypothetical protein
MTMEVTLRNSIAVALVLACAHLPAGIDMKAASQPLRFSNPAAIGGRQSAPVHVAFSLERDVLIARFHVETAAIHARTELPRNQYPYDFDVVELFVTNAITAKPSYYEFEVSPYNQALQVNVIDPRQEYYFGVKNGFQHAATVTATGWDAEMRIPLRSLGWTSGQPVHLIGNAYAALGEGDERVYWSLFELPAGPPDFHVPSAFRPLF